MTFKEIAHSSNLDVNNVYEKIRRAESRVLTFIILKKLGLGKGA